MGNTCFPAKHQKLQEKFSEGIVLRPCKAHFDNSVKTKWTTLLAGPTFDSHLTCLAALIEAGADVNETSQQSGVTALHFHPLQDRLSYDQKLGDAHLQCIKLLVEKVADVNIRDKYGQLPLHRAAEADHVKCVELFVQLGADVNVKDNRGKTPLFVAAYSGRYECIEKLIELGAGVNINVKDNKGETPLLAATENGKHECIKRLVELGADVNLSNNDNHPPLIILAKKAFHSCLEFIIQSGANVNIQDHMKRTALIEAACKKDHTGIQILLDSGADVNHCTDNNLNALMFAAWCDQWRPSKGTLCVKILLKGGAHVNKINKFGQNALQISVASNTTFCDKKEDYGDHYGRDVIMLLLAAGESIKGTTVDRLNYDGRYIYTQDVPQYLQDYKKIQLSLKWACREAIRKKLIESYPHTNLFIKVPMLGLPKPLQSYLLYDMSVECREVLCHVK